MLGQGGHREARAFQTSSSVQICSDHRKFAGQLLGVALGSPFAHQTHGKSSQAFLTDRHVHFPAACCQTDSQNRQFMTLSHQHVHAVGELAADDGRRCKDWRRPWLWLLRPVKCVLDLSQLDWWQGRLLGLIHNGLWSTLSGSTWNHIQTDSVGRQIFLGHALNIGWSHLKQLLHLFLIGQWVAIEKVVRVEEFRLAVGRLQALDQVGFFTILGLCNFISCRTFGNHAGDLGVGQFHQFVKIGVLVRASRNRNGERSRQG